MYYGTKSYDYLLSGYTELNTFSLGFRVVRIGLNKSWAHYKGWFLEFRFGPFALIFRIRGFTRFCAE